jgi:hypothetical protein
LATGQHTSRFAEGSGEVFPATKAAVIKLTGGERYVVGKYAESVK